MNNTLSTLALVLCVSGIQAQVKPERLKVYVDCNGMWCDETYIRTEINIVDFLLDRIAADVHILITNQSTGSGGRNYQLIFYGQNKFKSYRDTLRFDTSPNATDFERREKLVNYMRYGLAPLVAKTLQVEHINLSMKSETSKADSASLPKADKWNYWVFRLRSNGSFSGERIYKSSQLNYGLTANRTTDKIKLSFSLNAGRNVVKYQLTDSLDKPYTERVDNRDFNIDHYLIRSISDHWSYGYNVNISGSTFTNVRNKTYFYTALEYDIFPYKEVNNKLITISYGFDVRRYAYYDSTIFNKTNEVLYGHSLRVSTSLNQKWGYVNTGIAYHNYLHNWKLNSIGLNVDTEVRVTGGLSFWTYIYGGIIHDQVYLPGEGANAEDILTRRRKLASSYNFEVYFGLTYRFGSKLNNFVNPRFSGSANDF